MIENTIGSAVGGALDMVVKADDLTAVCRLLMGHSIVSQRELERKLQFSPEKASATMDELFVHGILGESFGNGSRRAVVKEELEKFLSENEAKEAKAERVKFSTPLAGLQPTKKKLSLDDLIGEIGSLPQKEVFTGAERAAKIEETISRLCDIIVRFNQGLEALEKVCDIAFADTPASITRIESSESHPNGGWKISYREWEKDGVNRVGEWSSRLTQSWLDEKVQAVEAWAIRTLAKKKAIAVGSLKG